MEKVRVKLPTELPESSLEITKVNPQTPRQSEEREVVSMTTEREDSAALPAEVLVDRRTRAAIATLERRYRTNRDGFDCHLRGARPASGRQAPNELPQPQVCVAFGLLNTKPLPRSAVS